MQVTLVISSLSSGGAERALSLMANYWADKGWRITLLTFDDGSEPPFYDLHPAVMHRPLDIAGHSTTPIQRVVNNLKRLWDLRRAIRESAPQAVFSLMTTTNILTILSTFWLRIPVIVGEQISFHCPIDKVWTILRTWTYLLANGIVVQAPDSLTHFSKVLRRKTHIIPNPVRLPLPPKSAKQNSLKKWKTVIAMGRLVDQKRFDLLLEAFARASQSHPEWSLVIWGEGNLRAELEALRDELGLKGRVSFPGLTQEPDEKMRQADLFVLSSRYEGFPMVLGEAMACGLPVVSFDCPTGPREIIRDGIDGILVPAGDVHALATALGRLMSNVSERERLATRAPEVVERFGVEKVMGMWETVLHNTKERSSTKSNGG